MRSYIDELIAESVQIQDIEPYSPVHSIHGDADEQNLEDDIDILSGDESTNNNAQTTALAQPQEFYHLTFTSDDLESTSVDEREISQLLGSMVAQIDQMVVSQPRIQLQ